MMPPSDLISTRMPTQGDGGALGQDADGMSQQVDFILSAPVSTLKLGGTSSSMTLGRHCRRKKSSTKLVSKLFAAVLHYPKNNNLLLRVSGYKK